MIKVLSVVIAIVAALSYIIVKWMTAESEVIKRPDALYDFIIVGAGTAGSVLAARLTENAKFKVLLVEAGGEESWMSTIPLLSSYLQTTEMNWMYKTQPQTHAMSGLHENAAMWPRGKGLGGSSSINNMVHMFGVPHDYDRWSHHYGLKDWDYQSVSNYFKKCENIIDNCKDDRGCNGPLKISKNEEEDGLGSILMQAMSEMDDFGEGVYNDEDGLGFSMTESNTFDGKRYGTAQAYLRPAMSRPNLHVLINARVTKVIFAGKRAVGVRLITSETNEIFEPRASREVILSAGVISSPHLLILSGIGDSKELAKLGIKKVADLPKVGKGLTDQLALPIYFHLDHDLSLNPYKLKSLKQTLNYLIYRKGYFSHTGVEVVGRISMGNETNHRLPQHLVLALNIGSVNKDLYMKISNMKDEAFEEIFPDHKNESKEGFILLFVCLHPQSRGEVKVVSSNPFMPPVIDPQYLVEDHDVDCLAKGYKFASILAKTDVMQKVGARVHMPNHEECRRYPKNLKSRDYLRCLVRMTAITAYHPLGTCSMPSVVDSQLRVHGVTGLRVVDGSVLPTQVSATPHATIVTVAEKVADLIKDQHSSWT